MFTKYPKVFLEVRRKMKGNMAVGNIKKSWFITDNDVELLIDQVVFETLSTLEEIHESKLIHAEGNQ